jgi:hypothetical protein
MLAGNVHLDTKTYDFQTRVRPCRLDNSHALTTSTQRQRSNRDDDSRLGILLYGPRINPLGNVPHPALGERSNPSYQSAHKYQHREPHLQSSRRRNVNPCPQQWTLVGSSSPGARIHDLVAELNDNTDKRLRRANDWTKDKEHHNLLICTNTLALKLPRDDAWNSPAHPVSPSR